MHVAARLEPRKFEGAEGRKQRRVDIVCQAGNVSLCGSRPEPAADSPANVQKRP